MNKGGRRYTSLQREEQPPFFIFTMKIFSFIFLGFLTGPDMEIGGGFRPNSGEKKVNCRHIYFFPPSLMASSSSSSSQYDSYSSLLVAS